MTDEAVIHIGDPQQMDSQEAPPEQETAAEQTEASAQQSETANTAGRSTPQLGSGKIYTIYILNIFISYILSFLFVKV